MVIKTKYGNIALNNDDVIQAEDGKTIIVHDALMRIATELNIVNKIKTTLLYANWISEKNFSFVYKAEVESENGNYEAIGESNNAMADSIGKKFPSFMAYKRAVDNVIVLALGMEDRVYEDNTQQNQNAPEKPVIIEEQTIVPRTANVSSKKEEKVEKKGDFSSLKEAENTKVSFGIYKKNPITVKELKETSPDNYDWLLTKYNISAAGNKPTDMSKKAALYIENKNK